MTSSPPPAKPILRGWSHAVAAGAAVGATLILGAQTRDDSLRFISVLVYGVSLVLLFATSALYHVGSWSGRWRTILRAVDHANIFLVIAGTYTPICVIVLSGWLRSTVLGAVWAAAGLGIFFTVATLRLPRWLMASLYVATGWIALFPGPQLIALLPVPALVLLVAGGLLYTLGAVVYARRWPDPAPRVFGYHEVFHTFVIAGSLAFFLVIWVWVVPFPRA